MSDDLRMMHSNPAMVNQCTNCKQRCNLRRHIKELNDRYFAICYDCSEQD
jgi:hypothetical protein